MHGVLQVIQVVLSSFQTVGSLKAIYTGSTKCPREISVRHCAGTTGCDSITPGSHSSAQEETWARALVLMLSLWKSRLERGAFLGLKPAVPVKCVYSGAWDAPGKWQGESR